MECLKMQDKTKNEEKALEQASQNGGEYITSEGLDNYFAGMSPEHWKEFIECVVTGFTNNLRQETVHLDDDIPF